MIEEAKKQMLEFLHSKSCVMVYEERDKGEAFCILWCQNDVSPTTVTACEEAMLEIEY